MVSTLIKQKYIISIKEKKSGILLKNPETMFNYFKHTLTNFKTPETYKMPLLLYKKILIFVFSEYNIPGR